MVENQHRRCGKQKNGGKRDLETAVRSGTRGTVGRTRDAVATVGLRALYGTDEVRMGKHSEA
jgi:hypothetical protein